MFKDPVYVPLSLQRGRTYAAIEEWCFEHLTEDGWVMDYKFADLAVIWIASASDAVLFMSTWRL
jgi:hypothetical protein